MTEANFRIRSIGFRNNFINKKHALLVTLIEDEISQIHRMTAEFDRNILKKELKRRKKAQQCLKKCSTFLDKNFDDETYRNLTEYQDLEASLHKLLSYFNKKIVLPENSTFHNLHNSNLFLSSILLYALISEKNNDDWLIKLFAPGKSEIEKISKIILDKLNSLQKEDKANSVFPTLANDTYPFIKLKAKFLPVYSNVKKLSGLKSELQRTLLNGKHIRIKSKKDLKSITDKILSPSGLKAFKLLFKYRYEWMVHNQDKSLVLAISQAQDAIQVNQTKGKTLTLITEIPLC